MHKKYYATTQNAKQKARVRSLWLRNRAVVLIAKAVPCVDCGGSFPPECMDFDHVRGKKSFEISAHGGRALSTIVREIEKCDVVCANCHRIRTTKRNGPVA